MKFFIYVLIIIMFIGFNVEAEPIGFGIKTSLYYSGFKDYNEHIESYHYNKIGLGFEFGASAIYFIKEKLALRGDATIYITSSSRDNEKVELADGSYFYVTSKYTFVALPLMLNLLFYPQPDNTSRFYFGGGMGIIPVGVSYSFQSRNNENDTTFAEDNSDKDNSTCFGLQILGGWEYFITNDESFSINAELLLRVTSLKFDTGTEKKSAGYNGAGFFVGLNYYLN